jgi:hypothetical protein
MKRRITTVAAVAMALAFLLALSGRQTAASDPGAATSVPRLASVEVSLLKAPGLNMRDSRWEIAYEFRITNEIGLWEATQRRRLNGPGEKRIGALIKEGSVAHLLTSPADHKFVLQIPFTTAALEKLRQQPQTRINLTATTATAENIKLNKEQEVKSQVFIFSAVVRVHDAKLNKTMTIPIDREWDFANFPDARFEITIEINGPDSFSVNSSRVKNAGNSITIVK